MPTGPADHRRFRRRHRHEPLEHDAELGRALHLLHAKAYEYASILAAKGQRVVDLSFAGGFALEDSIFKALALGAPFTKLVCMGRAVMIPGFLGANIEGALHPERKEAINGNWDRLPKTVDAVGATAEEIFACYFDIQKKVGKDEMKHIPYGAMAFWTLADKLACGLQQLMAGARKFSLNQVDRGDLFAANRETAAETGIAHCSDAKRHDRIPVRHAADGSLPASGQFSHHRDARPFGVKGGVQELGGAHQETPLGLIGVQGAVRAVERQLQHGQFCGVVLNKDLDDFAAQYHRFAAVPLRVPLQFAEASEEGDLGAGLAGNARGTAV
jgi:hypothetical protein